MGIISAILKRPSQRTLYEAQITGLSVLLLSSIATPIYICFLSNSALWLKLLSGFGGVALFLLMFSNLSMTYLQYYTFKMQMGLYPLDTKLKLKIQEFQTTVKEVNELIKESEDVFK